MAKFCRTILVMLVGVSFLWSCSLNEEHIFEAKKDFESQQWLHDSLAVFDFEITEPNLNYDIYFTLRSLSSYQYCNLYTTYKLQNADGKVLQANMQESILVDCKTGQPLGKGVGDLFDHQQLTISNYKFEKGGKYRLSFGQYMRQDTLANIVSVGTKVIVHEQEGK